jgi:hypothetical protein
LRESYDFEIHDLLTRQANARDEPGNGGMKPECGTKNFFGQVLRPIVAADVKELVTGNRSLELRVHRRETLGQKNYRRGEAKGDRRIYIGGKTKLGGNFQTSAHPFEGSGGFREQRNWRRRPAEVAKLQKSHREDCESHGDSHEDYGSEYLGDERKARKMPVGDGGAGCRDDADGRDVRRDNNCGGAWKAMPGLDYWEHQTNGEERPPIHEKDARLADLEKPREKSGGQHEQSDLGAPKNEIRKPQRRVHRRLRLFPSITETLILFPRSCA